MPAYRYRAVHASGRIAQGVIAAANEAALAHDLISAGFELIAAKPKKEWRRAATLRRVPPRLVADTTAHIADILKSGLPFAEALEDVAPIAAHPALRDALGDILRSVRHGSRIADAFRRHPRLFTPVFASILAAGEAGGDLPATFAQLARYAETRAATEEKLRRALRYPLFLFTVAFAAVTFMLALVVPQVTAFLSGIDSNLPPATRILIAASDFFAASWWMIFLASLCGGAILVLLRGQSSNIRRATDALALRLPAFGHVLHKRALARFAHSFAALFQSGIGLPAALAEATATLNNRALEALANNTGRRIHAGQALSSALADLFPPSALGMVRVGEKSGNLAKSLNDVAAACDRDANAASEKLIGLLEPALTLLIGVVLAWVVLAVLGPIYGALPKLNVVP
jgi:type IV pilus assembly protein PilC